MSNFFARLLHRNNSGLKQQSSEAAKFTYEQIECLHFVRVLELTAKASLTMDEELALLQRLFMISLFDNHVAESDRKTALAMAEALQQRLEERFAAVPSILLSLREARAHLLESAKQSGYETIAWKLLEHRISTDDVISFAMNATNRTGLEAFLKSIYPSGMSVTQRRLFIRELVWQQQRYACSNAVVILHGLAASGDVAVGLLFSVEEKRTLLMTPSNYPASRKVLADLGLLPTSSGARPFSHVEGLRDYSVLIFKDRCDDFYQKSAALPITPPQQEILTLTFQLLLVHLLDAQLSSIFADIPANEVFDPFKGEESLEAFRKSFSHIYASAEDQAAGGVSLDFALLYGMMISADGAMADEASFGNAHAFLKISSDLLNKERVRFLEYLRFMLRRAVDTSPSPSSGADDQAFQSLVLTYRQHGASSALAERVINAEDWIGERVASVTR